MKKVFLKVILFGIVEMHQIEIPWRILYITFESFSAQHQMGCVSKSPSVYVQIENQAEHQSKTIIINNYLLFF